jgi:GNAT superfamily N-acetyltransferase
MGHHDVLTDGTAVLVRPLVHGDRDALAAGFEKLSEAGRHLRFFNPPAHLQDRDLEYLTNIDYHDHFAFAAFAEDEPGRPGIGVGRYIRVADAPESAEVAVTVLDEYQRRGLGTLLLRHLAEVAADNGIKTFLNYVLWQNADIVAGLADEGARITPEEPGIARIEIDLPMPVDDTRDPLFRRLLHLFAQHLRDVRELLPPLTPGSRGQLP